MLWLTVIALIPVINCHAENRGFYCEYTPKTPTGSIFFLDLFSDDAISAAVMELYFDSSMVQLHDVSAVQKTSSVRFRKENGMVRIAFADSGAISGHLLRVSMKALHAGNCIFVLHPVEATDRKADPINHLSDCKLEIKLGKEDVSSQSAVKTSAQSQKNSSSKSSRSSRSEMEDNDSDRLFSEGRGFYDLRENHVWPYILTGAGAVVLIILIMVFGVVFYKKVMMNRKPDDKPCSLTKEVLTEPVEQTDDDNAK